MQKTKQRLAVIVIFGAACLLGFLLMRFLQATLSQSTVHLGIDLYPRWVGSQAALQGRSPYSLETRHLIWQAVYGTPEKPAAGNPFGFYYPPAIITLLVPFILAGVPLTTAAVLWCALLFGLWFTLLSIWILELPAETPHRLAVMVLILLGGLLFRPAFSNYILGQYSLFSMVMLMAGWLAYRRGWHILVGICAALALIKPSLMVLPVGLFFLLYYRSLKGWLAFLAVMIILYLPPTLMLGWWVPDFLRDLSAYTAENRVSWSARDILTLPGMLWLALSLGLIVWGLMKKDKGLALAAALALNAIFVPHTADYDLVALTGLLVWLGGRWLAAMPRAGLMQVLFFILLFFPWISLIGFLGAGQPEPVEGWYRFIWMAYPLGVAGCAAIDIFVNARYPLKKHRI